MLIPRLQRKRTHHMQKMKKDKVMRSLYETLAVINFNIYEAEQTFELYKTIKKYISQLSKNTEFRLFFHVTFFRLLEYCILIIAKIYEEPFNRYPNMSMKTALEDLKNTPISNKAMIYDFLQKKKRKYTGDIINDIIDYFSKKNKRLDKKLEVLLYIRDKKIAHSEDVYTPPRLTFSQFEKSFKTLINHAKEFYETISDGIGHKYGVNGGSFIENVNAKSASLSLKKLLNTIL